MGARGGDETFEALWPLGRLTAEAATPNPRLCDEAGGGRGRARERAQSRIIVPNHEQGAPVAKRVVLPDDWRERLDAG